MNTTSRRLHCPSADASSYVTREWLVANGLGGYASGTVSGIVTRRYHGLLVSALPAPTGRMVMLSHLDAQIRLPSGRVLALAPDRPAAGGNRDSRPAVMTLVEFRLELGLPTWRYES